MSENSIGFEIRTLSNLLKRRTFGTNAIPGGAPPTEMHGMVIDYLYQYRDQDIYQRDIEARFSIRRSTASGILRLMEKKGIITRESVAEDARLKKLMLTADAIAIHEIVKAKMIEVETQIRRDISPEDLRTFFDVVNKIKQNLE